MGGTRRWAHVQSAQMMGRLTGCILVLAFFSTGCSSEPDGAGRPDSDADQQVKSAPRLPPPWATSPTPDGGGETNGFVVAELSSGPLMFVHDNDATDNDETRPLVHFSGDDEPNTTERQNRTRRHGEPEATETPGSEGHVESPCQPACGSGGRCENGDCICDDGHRLHEGICVSDEPCAAIECSADERCHAGQCLCRDGFSLNSNGVCEADVVSPLENRTVDEVCGRWNAFTAPNVSWMPTPGAEDPCDPGHVPDDAQDAAIARVNLYRWLVGLPPVGIAASILAEQQECAVVMDANNQLTHHPSPDLECYTPGAAQGAGSSNLALGTNLVQSVDLFVDDRGVPSLGHRRWVFNPGMETTAFGHKGRGTCMYSFSRGGAARPDFIAWPPPGLVPTQAAKGRGSITLHGIRPGADFRLEALMDGEFILVELDRLGGNYGGGTTYSFAMPMGSGRNGASVTFSMRGLRETEDVTWTTSWIDCESM